MKQHLILGFSSTLLFMFTACQKKLDNTASSFLEASKSEKIAIGEPVRFSASGQAPTDSTTWQVSPSEFAQIRSNGMDATIIFNRAGTYIIQGQTGILSQSSTVSVTDSVYQPPVDYSTISEWKQGDQLQISAIRIDSGMNTGLALKLSTTETYNCLNSLLPVSRDFSQEGFHLTVDKVLIPSPTGCISGQSKITGFTQFYPISEGTHPFQISLLNTTYNGSVERIGSTIRINWPTGNDVTISPLIFE